MSNCQDGCQTDSRRYDDLLSTDRFDLSNTYRVIVLVWLGAVRSATPSVSWVSCLHRHSARLCMGSEWAWPCTKVRPIPRNVVFCTVHLRSHNLLFQNTIATRFSSLDRCAPVALHSYRNAKVQKNRPNCHSTGDSSRHTSLPGLCGLACRGDVAVTSSIATVSVGRHTLQLAWTKQQTLAWSLFCNHVYDDHQRNSAASCCHFFIPSRRSVFLVILFDRLFLSWRTYWRYSTHVPLVSLVFFSEIRCLVRAVIMQFFSNKSRIYNGRNSKLLKTRTRSACIIPQTKVTSSELHHDNFSVRSQAVAWLKVVSDN